MVYNYFDELLQKPSVFRAENKLDHNFIPPKLPHREKELSLLSQLFLALITSPNKLTRKVLITGKTGVGKTVSVKVFSEMIKQAASKRSVHINYIHINCRKERTSYKVLVKILLSIKDHFPKRGYSTQDLLEILLDHLKTHQIHLLICLDELSYLINKGEDLVYSLTRINDDTINSSQNISIIGIVRDISCLNNLDISTQSTLQRNIVKFSNYNIDQIYDILSYRANISFKEGTISNEVLKMISEIVFENGDLRYGLNLMWRAGKIAESKKLNYISHECIRISNQALIQFTELDSLKYLTKHKLLFLLSVVRAIKDNSSRWTTTLDGFKTYRMLSENLGLKNRSYTQVWNYLQEFHKESLLTLKILSENIVGRKTIIEIFDISLNTYEEQLIKQLNAKGINI